MQHAREEEIAERKAMKRAERDIARKKEFVRRVRLQIEDKRAEVRIFLLPPRHITPSCSTPPLPGVHSLAPEPHASVHRLAVRFSQYILVQQLEHLARMETTS